MNSREQLAQALYQARQSFDAIEEQLDYAGDAARATLARIQLARRKIDAWRISVVHAACDAQANPKGSEGGGESPPPEERTS